MAYSRFSAAAALSQRDLAFEGCTSAYVSRIEAGARVPSLQILREFAARLGVSVDYLATGSESSEVSDPLFEARISFRLGDLEGARKLLRKLVRASDARERARAQAALGALELRESNVNEAARLLEEALETRLLPRQDEADAADGLGSRQNSAGSARRST